MIYRQSFYFNSYQIIIYCNFTFEVPGWFKSGYCFSPSRIDRVMYFKFARLSHFIQNQCTTFINWRRVNGRLLLRNMTFYQNILQVDKFALCKMIFSSPHLLDFLNFVSFRCDLSFKVSNYLCLLQLMGPSSIVTFISCVLTLEIFMTLLFFLCHTSTKLDSFTNFQPSF